MFNSAAARRLMVDGQIRTADVTDPGVLDAMMTVQRERFVPPALAELAYRDDTISIGRGRALLKPMVLAKLLHAAHVRPQDHVLDVGCGTGYSSAILARLAASVMALEEDRELAHQAQGALADVGAANVQVVSGPLTAGWPAAAPYDVILLNGAIEVTPDALGRQLKPDGRLACVYGRSPATTAMIFTVVEGRLAGRPAFDAAAARLPGFLIPPTFVF